MTALLVLASLVVTAAETLVADLADARAIAQAWLSVNPSALGDTRAVDSPVRASSLSVGALSDEGIPAGVVCTASADEGRRSQSPCDDDGVQPCDCPCDGPCPCALLHASALPAIAGPVTSADAVPVTTRTPAHADLAPRSPARERALRPPIA